MNSNAIESQLHRLNGTTPLILYLNDDILIGRPLQHADVLDADGERVLMPVWTYKWAPAPPDLLAVSAWHQLIWHTAQVFNRFVGAPESERVREQSAIAMCDDRFSHLEAVSNALYVAVGEAIVAVFAGSVW
jgi:hypothetical protein